MDARLAAGIGIAVGAILVLGVLGLFAYRRWSQKANVVRFVLSLAPFRHQDCKHCSNMYRLWLLSGHDLKRHHVHCILSRADNDVIGKHDDVSKTDFEVHIGAGL